MKALIVGIIIFLNATLCFSADKVYIIPEPVRNAILNYLIKQPYEEVAAGVQALMGLKEAPPELPQEAPKPEVKK